MWLLMDDINAVQNGKKNVLESSGKHQMQRQSSTLIVNGMPNRQRDISECNRLQRHPQHCGKEENKTENQTNLNYIDKTPLGQLKVDYQGKLSKLSMLKIQK